MCAANRLTIKNEDSCLAERCRGEAANGLGIWRQSGAKSRRCEAPGPQHLCSVQGLGASPLTRPLVGLQNVTWFPMIRETIILTPLKPTIKGRVSHNLAPVLRGPGEINLYDVFIIPCFRRTGSKHKKLHFFCT